MRNDSATQAASVIIEEFAAVSKNSLLGFARVRLPSGMILIDVGIYKKDGKPWASPPSKPMIGRDGTQLRGSDGKGQYKAVVEFASRELRDKFSSSIIEALRAARPEVLA